MEKGITAKTSKGTWMSLPTAEEQQSIQNKERKPKVEFIVNKPVTVEFKSDFQEPLELGNETDGYYYLFDVLEKGTEKVIITSAWSLLRGLKLNYPLADKKIFITKLMERGKQNFKVELIS